jgi:hypothetical protein
MNNSYSSGLINIGNTNPLPFTSTLDATYRSPSVAGGNCSSKMSGGYKYKKKKRLSKRHSKSKTSNEEFMFPSVNKIVGGKQCSIGKGRLYTKGGRRRRGKRISRSNRQRNIGMSFDRGVSRPFFGGNTNGSGNIPTFPTGYSLGGNYNTLGGALANPPIYTPTYDHLIRQNV